MKISATEIICALLLLGASGAAFADGTPAVITGFTDDSELGAAVVSGNTSSATYDAQQKNSYTWDSNVFKLGFRYLNTQASGVDTARNWDASLRYERQLSDVVNAFADHTVESDVFAGYVQRNNFDLGGKYFFTKSDDTKWSAEAGYRYSFTHNTGLVPDSTNNEVRVYSEVVQNISKTSSFKFWVEYVQTVASTQTTVPGYQVSQDYFINAEPSVSVMLNDLLSLKSAYLMKYHNYLPPGSTATKNLDTVFTTSLVAKF